MKRIILLAALSLGIATSSNAQNKTAVNNSPKAMSTIEATAKQETDKLDKIVSLTPQQRANILEINTSLAKRLEILNSSNSQNKEEMTKQLEKNRIEMYSQQLTVDQQVKYKHYLSDNHLVK